MNISEDTLATWAKGPSQTETDKCENAEKAIRDAFNKDEAMKALDVSIFATGSYRVRTNVKQDSDVDICVRFNSAIFPKYLDGITKEELSHTVSTFTYADFKNKVEHALHEFFGEKEVVRGDKAFRVNENSYRIVADVVATFGHHLYARQTDGTIGHRLGVGFDTDKKIRIHNYPQQTYDNGVARNNATGKSHKRVIRILKRLRNKMQDEKIPQAANIGSFLIESLVWNAPLTAFKYTTWTAILREVLANVYNDTRESADCSKWTEVNNIKLLFGDGQPWTKDQANNFLYATWTYMGYE